MSIVEQIARIQTNIANAYSSCEAKGATLPKIMNSDNLASVIDSIKNGGEGGNGAIIDVLNKTGAVINPGDKVWLSENVQEAGKGNTVGDSFNTPTKTGVLSRSGNFMVFTNTSYSISADTTVTKIGSFTCDVGNIKYGTNQSIFSTYLGSSYRIDERNQYKLSAGIYIGENFSADKNKIYHFNVEDGTILEERGPFYAGNESFQIMLNDTIIYDLKRWEKGVYNDSAWDRTSLSVTNKETVSIYPLNATSDGKYIISSLDDEAFITNTYLYSKLRIIEIIDDTHVKVLTQSEMPEDLQTYYSAPCYIAFNPYTGILTVCEKDSQNYAVVRYENGEWLKIPMTFELPSNNCFYGGMTISDDLSRISYVDASKGSSYIYQRITNLTSTEGYTAIPYKPYTVNEKTITATALAESQPNELTQVQIGSVTNEDLTVTENGTYTPSATYTGFGSVTVNIESPMQVVTAINKTGETINSGDKVWLSENTQSADTSYILDSGSANFGSYGFINSSGLVAYGSKGKYSLDATSGTLIDSSFTIFPYLLYYTSAGCMYYRQRSGGASGDGSYFITPTGEVTRTIPTLINSNGYQASTTTSSTGVTINKYNTLTQELEQTWGTIEKPSYNYSVYFIVKNRVYVGYSSTFKYKTLYDDGTVSESWIDATRPSLPADNCIIGNTLDEKYIMSIGNYINYGFRAGGAVLKMWETLDSGDIVYLTQSEMPADLQKYVDGNNLITFNPKNGVLAVCKYQEQTYDIVKYENETWTKLPIQLNLEEGETFESAITLSEDLTRACARTTNGAKIFNLTDLDGYTAISYNPSAVNAQSLTGIASSTAEPNAEVEVGVVK